MPETTPNPNQVTFGNIKRSKRFRFKGQEWKRTQGHFATKINRIGTGDVGWPFDLKTPVQPL